MHRMIWALLSHGTVESDHHIVEICVSLSKTVFGRHPEWYISALLQPSSSLLFAEYFLFSG